MNDNAKSTVDKLKIIREMSQNNEVQQLAKVMISYISNDNKPEAGFIGGGTSDDKQK